MGPSGKRKLSHPSVINGLSFQMQAKAENIMALVKKHHLHAPVYVGDTKGDFEACQKAGVDFIFASYGYGTVENPDYIIKKPADLLTICR